MTEAMNGHQPTEELKKALEGAEAAPEQQAQVNPADATAKAQAVIEANVRLAIGVMIRGLLVSMPGIPAHFVLNAIAKQTANLCAESVQGPLMAILPIRKGLKEAFDLGIKQAKIIEPPAAPPKPMTAGILPRG